MFEIWGDDRPEISEPNGSLNEDCIYVRFPSIAQAIDGINVFDGIQPNGYSLSAELVLEGSQIVYIDGLDGDWNEEIFKNFVDINSNYKVSIKKINDAKGGSGDKAYAFVQFASLEAVQSAIDRFDGETEIDGKLVRWEHMVKAYIGKIGPNTTISDIQRELSDFDPSFKHLPIEIRKSREPVYYKHDDMDRYETDITSDDTERIKLKQKFNEMTQHKTARRKLTYEPESNQSNELNVTDLSSLELPRVPSRLATIKSLGHLESNFGSMDSNDVSFSEHRKARDSQCELLSPSMRKKLAMQKSRSHSDTDDSLNLKIDKIVENHPPLTTSKSTNDLRNLKLPVLVSSGEEDPYLSTTSMASMPLYSQSVTNGTPKQILEMKSASNSPLALDTMKENKEMIIQQNPLRKSYVIRW